MRQQGLPLELIDIKGPGTESGGEDSGEGMEHSDENSAVTTLGFGVKPINADSKTVLAETGFTALFETIVTASSRSGDGSQVEKGSHSSESGAANLSKTTDGMRKLSNEKDRAGDVREGKRLSSLLVARSNAWKR